MIGNLFHEEFFLVSIFSVVLAIQVQAASIEKTNWKTINNKNGWSIQYPKDWLNGEESSDFVEGRSPKGASSDFPTVFIRSPEVSKKDGQAAWIEIRIQNSGKSKQTIQPNREQLIPRLKREIEQRSVTYEGETKTGRELTVAGGFGYDEVVTLSYRSSNVETQYSSRVVVLVSSLDSNRGIKIMYHEGNEFGDNELMRDKWKFEKTFDEILSTFKFSD